MNTSNKQNRRLVRLFLLCAFIPLVLYVACDRDWFDNGTSYLCPECTYKAVHPAISECDICHCEIAVSYKYCYDCAKTMDCCQMCGIKR